MMPLYEVVVMARPLNNAGLGQGEKETLAGKVAQELLPYLQQPALAQFKIVKCEIKIGSAVSLNSVNGAAYATDGTKFFFKTHAEKGESATMGAEYYRAVELAKAGWPVIQPLGASHEPGKQMLMYEWSDAPDAYLLTAQLDQQFLDTGTYDEALKTKVLNAEAGYLDMAARTAIETLKPGTPDNANAALHQLFSHRLIPHNGQVPRVEERYTGTPDHMVTLPDGGTITFNDLAKRKWVVNGVAFPDTLAEMIAKSQHRLASTNMAMQPSAFLHGDDHNGNKKLLPDGTFTTFDPAFAGRVPVLLGLIKNAMHNAPVHPFWYYEPEKVMDKLKVAFRIEGDTAYLDHNGAEVLKSPLREAFFDLNAVHLWHPVLRHLAGKKLLWDGWQEFVQCAAFMCPFLAVNLIDPARANGNKDAAVFGLGQCMELFYSAADKLIPAQLTNRKAAS